MRITLIAAAVLLTGVLASSARAQVWVDMTKIDKVPEWADEKYVKPGDLGPREPRVVYRVVPVRRWCPPVYRPIYKRVWVQPVVRVWYERVWIEPRYEWVTQVCWEDGVKVIRQVWTLVSPGRWETIRREEIVTAGHWDQVVLEQQLIRDGYWETVEQRELVAR